MTTSQERAWKALSDRLRAILPASTVDAFIGGTHTRRFADNLLPGFSSAQIQAVREQLSRGAGGELKPTRSGKRRAHAPYSSAALAANALGRWIGTDAALEIAGIDGFDEPLSLEHKLRIAHNGGEANLDCVLQAPGLIVGIESKLTEHLTRHDPVEWRPPYHAAAVQKLLDGGWADVFRASLDGHWRPQHLGLEQLIKHALALQSHAHSRETRLIYCFWEPSNADAIPEIQQHRDEVAELRTRVDGASPQLRTLSYPELFAEWESLEAPPEWLAEHVAQLRARYDVAI